MKSVWHNYVTLILVLLPCFPVPWRLVSAESSKMAPIGRVAMKSRGSVTLECYRTWTWSQFYVHAFCGFPKLVVTSAGNTAA